MGMNVLWSVAVFLLLFVLWYFHKRGKEERERMEREAAGEGAEDGEAAGKEVVVEEQDKLKEVEEGRGRVAAIRGLDELPAKFGKLFHIHRGERWLHGHREERKFREGLLKQASARQAEMPITSVAKEGAYRARVSGGKYAIVPRQFCSVRWRTLVDKTSLKRLVDVFGLRSLQSNSWL